MKKDVIILISIGIGALLLVGYNLFRNEVPATGPPRLPISGDFIVGDLEEITIPEEEEKEADVSSTTATTTKDIPNEPEAEIKENSGTEQHPAVEVLVENLTIPWDIAFLPNGHLLVSERGGTLIEFDLETGESSSIDVPDVVHQGEGGLLGIALHPDFVTNRYLYVYFTSSVAGKSINKVLRYTYENGILKDGTVIIDTVPGAFFHDGGRIAFGPDGYLYVTTGDAQDPEMSQRIESLAGKILRVTDTGAAAPGNPFDSEVYSYGHRNAQGLTWDDDNALWATEHGRSGIESGFDEINLIIKGGNYGWPEYQGDAVSEDTIGPVLQSGPSVTWAPAGIAYYNGSLFFGGLKGETLYEAVLAGLSVAELKEHFVGEFGRIRTVVLGPDNLLYITTSNRDGRGDIRPGDDKIIRIDPEALQD